MNNSVVGVYVVLSKNEQMILMNVIYLIYALLSMSLQDINDSPDRLLPV